MVYHDLSSFSDLQALNKKLLRIPSASDRSLAFIIDFLLFTPVIGLLTAVLSRKLKLSLILEASSSEIAVIWFLMFVFVLSASVLAQSYFWFKFGATPGQMFTQLRVRSFPDVAAPLTFGQCLLRSTLWFISLISLCVPFIEIFGHPLRRAFHERASDSVVVSLKTHAQEVPHPIESRFISSWLNFFFYGVFLFLFLFSWGVYTNLTQGKYAGSGPSDFLCDNVSGISASSERIEQAIANFMGRQISASCLNQEADYLLWFARDSKLRNWALFAKALAVTSQDLKISYEKALCDLKDSPIFCDFLKVVSGKQDLVSNPQVIHHFQQSVVYQIVTAQNLLQQKNYLEAAKISQKLRQVEGLQAAGNVLYVKSIVHLLKEKSYQDSGRQPASLEAEIIVQNFLREIEAP